jgi:hypothetical protein
MRSRHGRALQGCTILLVATLGTSSADAQPAQMLGIADTFRRKQMPLDALIKKAEIRF